MKNHMALEGNLGKAPESIKSEKSNFLVLSLAQNYTTKDGEQTSWFEISIFKPALMEKCTSLKKGDFLSVTGYITPVKKLIETKSIPMLKLIGNRVHKIEKLNSHVDDGLPSFTSGDEVPL